jgi:hypothetical protein
MDAYPLKQVKVQRTWIVAKLGCFDARSGHAIPFVYDVNQVRCTLWLSSYVGGVQKLNVLLEEARDDTQYNQAAS